MRGILNRIFGPSDTTSADKPSLERKLQLATAALLIQVASADFDYTEDERAEIISSLRRRFRLREDEVVDILQETNEELKQRIDIYSFTNLINEHFSREQKIQIIEMVWRVIYVDRHLSGFEDSMVHRLTRLMRLEHSDMIDAKLRIKEGLPSE